ncbi:MAG: hypothetical protein FJ088_10150, partial [Deltaproteobacteria bacterium]|nr:hypothetical protein [Deltaproteobacteria bacterium]
YGDQGEEEIVMPAPFGPENRGFKVMRGIVHLHSVYSHDGCDGKGMDEQGNINVVCFNQLREALCKNGIDYAMMTDHPSNAKDQKIEDGMLFKEDKGDTLIFDNDGNLFANKITCKDAPVDHVFIYFGTEGSNNMPIGLSGKKGEKLPGELFSSWFSDVEKGKERIKLIHEHDGFAFVAHSEEEMPEKMIELGVDGMEIYNLHTNFMGIFDNPDNLFLVDRFMGDPGSTPPSDLSLMLFLKPVLKDVEKFDFIIPKKDIAVIAASDAHQNVEIPALCSEGLNDGGLCENLAKEYPNFANFLITGGPVPLADGERMDSYGRVFRWFSNWTLVPSDKPDDIRATVGEGRIFAAFDLFGFPSDFDFFGYAGGKAIEMGEVFTAQGEVKMTLYIRTPKVSPPFWWPMVGRIDESYLAEVTTKLFEVTDSGSKEILSIAGQGKTAEITVNTKAAYKAEVTIKPKHLKSRLKDLGNLADQEYPFIYSNAIFVR